MALSRPKARAQRRRVVRRIGGATFARICDKHIALAGPRYTPALDPKAPNLEVTALADAFDALGFTPALRTRLGELRTDLEKAWGKHVPDWIRDLFREQENGPQALLKLLADLEASSPVGAAELAPSARATSIAVLELLRAKAEALLQEGTAEGAASPSERESHRDEIVHLMAPVEGVRRYLDSPAGALLTTNVTLLLGEWGTGKTHTLCDLVTARRRMGGATLLLLAQSLPRGDPGEAIAQGVGPVSSLQVVLRTLESLGRKVQGRAFLCIDAINEGDRPAWRRALPGLCQQLQRYPHVGLVMSCRTPFDREITTPQSEKSLILLQHPSFESVEADAQLAFFRYYGIPAPPYPLILPEFTRPLFLKLFCQSVQRLSRKRKELLLGEVIAGHAGITTVLEWMVKEQGRPIERELHLPPGFCWGLLKGAPLSGGSDDVGLAPVMGDTGRDFVLRSQCLTIIRQVLGGAPLARAEDVLQRLTGDGLLVEALGWEENAEPRIYFPYERFGEHLVARHLLHRHLDCHSRESIRRSFHQSRPLGRAFATLRGSWSYARPELASAIMLEFPERTKRALRPGDRELVLWLPRRARAWQPAVAAFLDGLQWRERDSFTPPTARLVANVLRQGNQVDYQKLFDTLLALSCRSEHPYAGRVLWRYLASLPVADRDLTWSEAVRSWDEASTLHRLMSWCEANAAEIPSGPAKAILRALALGLVTTVRPLRDRLTKCLFALGLRDPQALFALTVESLSFNDPYVPERLLAASYGVAMREWANPRARALQMALPRFARSLTKRMFAPGADCRTCHALMTGYAFGCIALGQRIAPGCLPVSWRRRARPPQYRPQSPFRDPARTTAAEVAEVEGAIRMDFNNYTLGRLVTGRRNYDDHHLDYQRIRTQILGRVFDLGYRKSRFEEIDRGIGQWAWRESNEGKKTDRYGKKYSWIAYFEMYGLRSAAGQLGEWRGNRPSDCDIDPSFPEPPVRWRPNLRDPFVRAPRSPQEWMTSGPALCYDALCLRSSVDGHCGPWVVLDGFIDRQQPSDGREARTFIRALLMNPRLVRRFERTFAASEYPGNDLHDIPEDYYTYAGEVPWSRQFGTDVRSSTGDPRPSRVDLLSQFQNGRWVHGPLVEVPVHECGWESYHSVFNRAGHAVYPSPAVCHALDLRAFGSVGDLRDGRGRLATLYRTWNDSSGDYFGSHLLYLRRDLLNRYLRQTGQVLVWASWGERLLAADLSEALHTPVLQAAHMAGQDQFRQVRVYCPAPLIR